MEIVAIWLNLMCANNTQVVILLEYLLDGVITVFEGALPFSVWLPSVLSRILIFGWIRPQKITQKTFEWWLNESIDAIDITHFFKLFGDSSVHTKIVLIDIRCNRQSIE